MTWQDALFCAAGDAKHKLKLTIPIAPLLLSYEGGFELGSRLDLATAWQAADELGLAVHDLAIEFPYTYADLRSQMLKSAGSVSDNIAEGYCRNALGDYIRFCEIARGSLGELGSQIQRCERWRLISGDSLTQVLQLYSDATYNLEQLIKSLRAKRQEGTWDRSLGVCDASVSYQVHSSNLPFELPEDFTDLESASHD